jgi:hypothetical protein
VRVNSEQGQAGACVHVQSKGKAWVRACMSKASACMWNAGAKGGRRVGVECRGKGICMRIKGEGKGEGKGIRVGQR